jgi:hypothetical protein
MPARAAHIKIHVHEGGIDSCQSSSLGHSIGIVDSVTPSRSRQILSYTPVWKKENFSVCTSRLRRYTDEISHGIQ